MPTIIIGTAAALGALVFVVQSLRHLLRSYRWRTVPTALMGAGLALVFSIAVAELAGGQRWRVAVPLVVLFGYLEYELFIKAFVALRRQR
jgi:ABC-type uncharacterized transport system YnjBCD ATPase subunit